MRYHIGIDEAGRGPLAGPVAVGAVMVPVGFDWRSVAGVRDSKQLSPNQRYEFYETIKTLTQKGELLFSVSFSSTSAIDRCGITCAIQMALNRCLRRVNAEPAQSAILLDGALKAPRHFTMQKTIIRGDETEPIIALASIVAKVTRDRLMTRYARNYPAYNFGRHKGYGTYAHRRAILQFGLCPLHRKTFCRNITSRGVC